MRRFALLFISLLGLSSHAFAFDHDHAAWTALLKQHVSVDGRVAYAKLKVGKATAAGGALRQYLGSLQTVRAEEFAAWSSDQQKAFLINAYNAFTVQLIVDNYPVASIRDIGGFLKKPWSIEFFNLLDGKAKTLDTIEHQLLRPVYKDIRIHAAVNCASISCPQLRGEAYSGARLNEQLEAQMRLWLADASRNQFAAASGAVKVSKIFDWYVQDFVAWGGGVREVLTRYGPPQAKAALSRASTIGYLDYNWQLNSQSE